VTARLMSDRELTPLEVLRDLDQRRLTTEAAGRLLGLERRQVFRLLKAYRTAGPTGLISKRRGRPSNRRGPGRDCQSSGARAGGATRARGQGASAGRKRGQGATVALSVRLARADWERLHQLAVAEGVSLQEIIVRGLSQVFTSKGLPGIGA
jgi:hypothetical protein